MANFDFKPQKIVVFRALQLGDLLVSIPAIRALRAANPFSRITLTGLPWSRQFAQRFNHLIDDWVEFPGHPALPEREADAQAFDSFIDEMQKRKFDLAIQLHGNGETTNPIVLSFLAKVTAGFYSEKQSRPPEKTFFPYPDDLPERLRLLLLMERLGFASIGQELEFPLSVQERQEALDLLIQYKLYPDRFVILHPGARAAERRWPVENFGAVGDALAEMGYKVVITGVTEEHAIALTLQRAMQSQFVDLVGKTSLGSLAALLEHAALLISNDTGISHIADALRIPSVILFTGSDPQRWAPQDDRLHQRVVGRSELQVPRVIERAQRALEAGANERRMAVKFTEKSASGGGGR